MLRLAGIILWMSVNELWTQWQPKCSDRPANTVSLHIQGQLLYSLCDERNQAHSCYNCKQYWISNMDAQLCTLSSCSLYFLLLVSCFNSFPCAFSPFSAPQHHLYHTTKAPANKTPLIATHSCMTRIFKYFLRMTLLHSTPQLRTMHRCKWTFLSSWQ